MAMADTYLSKIASLASRGNYAAAAKIAENKGELPAAMRLFNMAGSHRNVRRLREELSTENTPVYRA